jgi:hypothetical protein
MRRLVTLAVVVVAALMSSSARAETLEWIQQLGTSGGEKATGVSADGLGGVYISGYTLGSLEGTNAGNGDAFVAKFTEPLPLLGDVNFDGNVNGLDVDPFVDVLLNGSDDNATRVMADMNSDGEVNGLDVDPFVAAVVGGTQPVPEPSTLLLCLLALSITGALRKWGV